MGAETLSQKQIDELLGNLSNGKIEPLIEATPNRVRSYDFKRALRFSKDQIRSLTRIHENFARILGTSLSSELRNYVQVSVDAIDQIPYKEFIGSVRQKTILVTYEIPPLEGRILLEISPTIAFSILDRLLGGYGEEFEAKIRDSLTDIESRIMTQVFEGVGKDLQVAWEAMTVVEPEIDEVEVNAQFVQLVSPNETVVVVPLNVTIGKIKGMMNLCIPHLVLEPVLAKLSVQYQMQFNQKGIDPASLNHLTQNVKGSLLPFRALLGETSITIEEFTNLAVGDAIMLNQSVHEPLIIKVADEHKFYGHAGKSKNRLAIQIKETLKEGDDEYDR